MIRMCAYLISLVLIGGIGGATAQTIPVPPSKTISIYNNSTDKLFPAIQAPIMCNKIPMSNPIICMAGVSDLWLQAHFAQKGIPINPTTQIFNTTLLYKIYVNHKCGVGQTCGLPPGHFVTLTIPFYTQLLAVNSNLGTVTDQFIDWWNAMRIFVFDGKQAIDAAFNYSVDPSGAVIPPIPVNPVPGAAVPSCTMDNTNTPCGSLEIVAYVNGFPMPVPAQLVEYTFAAAMGPPLHPTFSIDRKIVNYNISGVDSMYMPAAMGAHNATGPIPNTYLGSTQDLASFRSALQAFTGNGTLWPFFVPAYYTAAAPTTPLKNPPSGAPYPLPQIPSANVVYAESFRVPPPDPPVLSSDTLEGGTGKLGTVAQATRELWKRCVNTPMNNNPTCKKIIKVNTFFKNDFTLCFGPNAPPLPTHEFLRDVYGWVQFPGCSTPLANAPGFKDAIVTFCELQYNYFLPSVPPNSGMVFNPYVSLVHETLKSNAYAFSIDDAVSFKSLPGDGIIVTIAGTNGLENTTQTPLPTATTFRTFCRNG